MLLILAEEDYDCWLIHEDPEQPPIGALAAKAMKAWK